MLTVMNPNPTSSDPSTRRAFVKASAVAAVAPMASAVAADQGLTKTPMREIETDVLVCGGGCAGTAAALSAARNGAKTLLVEKAPFAGGIITSVGLPYFDGIADIKTHRVVVRGIALELLAKAMAKQAGEQAELRAQRNQHGFDDPDAPVQDQPGRYDQIRVGRNTWLGNGSLVMADVGDRCVVAAGDVPGSPLHAAWRANSAPRWPMPT